MGEFWLGRQELQAGKSQKKGDWRGPTYAYNIKVLRKQETRIAEEAERSYEHLVAQRQPRRPKASVRRRLKPAGPR